MKEFEEMQRIWNTQDGERLYAIDDDALDLLIKRKSRSVERLLSIFEWSMIGVNLLVGIVLILEVLLDDKPAYQYTLPALYLAFSGFVLFRRQARRKEEVHFEYTMLGELDRAIWRINYLIKQGQSIVLWYVLPLVLLASIIMLLNSKLFWALGLMLVVLPGSYFGSRWEINKFYRPKQRALESLRQNLVASQQ